MRVLKFRAWVVGSKFMLQDQTPGTGNQKDIIYMQYTGLKDKNGKEIFEGDIVVVKARTGQQHITVVDFEEGEFVLKENDVVFSAAAYASNPDKNGEIIGNIYEDPELLK